MGIAKDLLAILVCPLCKAQVREEADRLICEKCNRRYPVRDGIPAMLIDEAELPSFSSPSDAPKDQPG